MQRNSGIRFNRQGLTLVEVLTSVVLLSTLLVGMLTAYSKLVRQIDRAEKLNIAVKITDQLLADWFRSPGRLAEYRQGQFEGHDEFQWRLTRRQAGSDSQYGAQILVLNVFHRDDEKPVLSIELLDEIPEATGGFAGG